MTAPVSFDELWLRRFRAAPAARTRLICFPHAGGAAAFYFPLSQRIAADVEVFAVQYPGRQDRRAEAVLDRIETLADRVAAAIGDPGPGRLAFFGHSMGAAVAFEVARRLEADTGRVLEVLLVSARPAPHLPARTRVHCRSDSGIVAELNRLSRTASAVLADPELRALALPAIRGDYRAIETYTAPAERRVRCPIHALAGEGDPIAAIDEVARWRTHTDGSFSMEVLRGGHFYLESWPAAVVRSIESALLAAAPARH